VVAQEHTTPKKCGLGKYRWPNSRSDGLLELTPENQPAASNGVSANQQSQVCSNGAKQRTPSSPLSNAAAHGHQQNQLLNRDVSLTRGQERRRRRPFSSFLREG